MSDRVLLVTGAGSGLGQLTAQQALANGWKVAALDLNEAGLDELEDQAGLMKIVADVTEIVAIQAAVDDCESTLGPITRLVNAAGIMPLGLLAETPATTSLKVMNVNYGGMLSVISAALPTMLERGTGEFVCYASMAGHWPTMYMGAYSAAKHAVATYAEVLYHETKGSGVRIVCVCPPPVSTPLLNHAKDALWPKVFNIVPPLEPQAVLDAIEKKLSKKRGLWVFPGPLTRLTRVLRRWFPSLMWAAVHRIEKK